MKAIQITVDEGLLAKLDSDDEVKREGRSAVIRRALIEYLSKKRRSAIRVPTNVGIKNTQRLLILLDGQTRAYGRTVRRGVTQVLNLLPPASSSEIKIKNVMRKT